MLNYSCAQDAENKVSTPKIANFKAELFIDQLQIPWGFAFLPDKSILITEKEGKLIHFSNGKKSIIGNIPEVYQRGQGGLLDIELHPNYEKNGWIYFTYASTEGDEKGGHTALMRAKLKNNSLTKTVEKFIVYTMMGEFLKTIHLWVLKVQKLQYIVMDTVILKV